MTAAAVSMLAPTVDKIRKTCEMVGLFQNWPLALLDRCHLVDGRPVVYALRSGMRFLVQAGTRDVRVINEIWIDKVYTAPSEFTIRDGWVVVDVGGHKGIFSLLAATSARNVRVFTFEPDPTNYLILRRNIELNGITNVKTFNVALSGADGEAMLHTFDGVECGSLLPRPHVRPGGDVPVHTWSLKHLLEAIGSPINLLKMDIEGMEHEVLLSCPSEALRSVERIALEYHDESSGRARLPKEISELVDFLTAAGFVARVRPERRILLAQRTAPSGREKVV